VVIRHLIGDPPEMATRATKALASSDELLLADLIVAECVYVLESFYELPRERVAELMRAAIALPTIKTLDPATLLRALEVYEVDRLDFAEAYLVAQAEATGVDTILSFDKSIDRVSAVKRHEP
jgi:predicted nucleic-acid-binding protein